MKKDKIANNLSKACEALVEMYVANIGTDYEFISCITPPHRKFAKKNDKCWKAWDNARKAISDYHKHKEKALK